ncbi:MAG: hypothetical protein GX242_03210 [Clostridiales bacterium]|nr:hypothetical protein [Clostridiales bacterium]
MKITELIKILDAKVISMPQQDIEISGGYCGDLLSFVMGRAPEKCAWFTIMNNANVAAVAALADIGVVVLCENVQPDGHLLKAVKNKEIALIVTALPIFEAARKI